MVTVKRVEPVPAQENDVELRLSASEARFLAKILWLYAAASGVLLFDKPRYSWLKYYSKSMSNVAHAILDRLRSVNILPE